MKVGTFKRRLKSLHYRGWTWEKIGNMFGHTRGWAHKIAYCPIPVSEEVLERADEILPGLLWEGKDELDHLVLARLATDHPITGRELARLCGTVDRTIRSSIERLREAGHRIDASMVPPRGYLLTMPKNCTTCRSHSIHYDAFGFDGCTCGNPEVKFGTFHNSCYEFCKGGFDPSKDDTECPHYKANGKE